MQLIYIEDYLRTKMIRTAEKKGLLSDPEVVTLSQQLDKYLTLAQHLLTQSSSLQVTAYPSLMRTKHS